MIALCYTTFADQETAIAFAKSLVKNRLAACASVAQNSRSFYYWQGELHDESECVLTIKTVREKMKEIEAFFASNHPYELPELISQNYEASEAYEAWVREGVGC
ncbi:divalent ion tolerance protein CutA [Campylobacterota bacterium]|nr:divalent ion tolerance protein CutA [Campylobacterota bacterium]